MQLTSLLSCLDGALNLGDTPGVFYNCQFVGAAFADSHYDYFSS